MVNPLTTQQVQDAAKPQVDVGSETLIISNAYLWRNDQPRFLTTAEESYAATLRGARAANLTLTIKRINDSTDGEPLESSILPCIVAVHVIRTHESLPSTPSADDLPPDAPTSKHFAWPSPAPSMASELTEESADAEGFFFPREMDKGSVISLSAWNGPRWGGLRNGIDDTITFNAVVEFEGGIFLRSGDERLRVVS